MPLTECPDHRMLSDFDRGELPRELFDSVAEHLSECDLCASRYSDMGPAEDELIPHLRASLPAELVADDAELAGLVDAVIAVADTADGIDDTDQTVLPLGDSVVDWSGLLLPAESSEEIGRLGGYRVLEVLGTGGMGVVFRAEDPQLNRIVALKAIRASDGGISGPARMRFLKEGRAAAAIEHDNIVTVYQVGDDDGTPFIAMQMLRGESLRVRLSEVGPLDPAEAVRIARQTSLGLAAAHAKGLVHRDIKPDNLWIEAESRRVKILDFGLAREISDDSGLTSSGMVVGTPAYLAPEQADGADVDERTDLFSLGVVFYEMLTGLQPFRQASLLATLKAIGTVTPESPSEVNPDIPSEVAAVVMKLLERDPADRFQSAAELTAVLESIEEQETVSPMPQAGPEGPRVPRRIRTAAAAFGFVCLLFASVFVYRLKETRDGVTTGEWVLQQYDEDVTVLIRQRAGKEPLKTIELERGEPGAVSLAFGTYEVEVRGTSDEMVRKRGKLVIRREGEPIVSLEQIPRIPQTDDTSAPNLALRQESRFDDPNTPTLMTLTEFKRGESVTMEGRFQGGETPTDPSALESRLMCISGSGGVLNVIRTPDDHLLLKTHYRERPTKSIRRQTLQAVDFSRPVHIAAAYEPGAFRLYVDGTLACRIDTQELAEHPEYGAFFSVYGTPGLTIDDIRISSVARYTTDFGADAVIEADIDTMALFDFDDGPDLVVTDSSGFARNALLGPEIAWSRLKDGVYQPLEIPPVPNRNYALKCDGGKRVWAGRAYPFTAEARFTMECTVLVENEPGTNHPILSLTGPAGEFVVEQTTSGHLAGRLRYGDQEHVLETGVRLPLNRPTHIAATCEPAHAQLFIDGRKSASVQLTSFNAASGTNPLFSVVGSGDFSIIIDEVRLSSVVRYDEDFVPAGRFEPDDQTEVLYHCDEGRYRWLRDSSRNNVHTHLSALAPNDSALWVVIDESGRALPAASANPPNNQ